MFTIVVIVVVVAVAYGAATGLFSKKTEPQEKAEEAGVAAASVIKKAFNVASFIQTYAIPVGILLLFAILALLQK
jgi:flagellar basal body-associated protein FliL